MMTPSARIALAQVTETPISVHEHAKLVDDQVAGALVTFGGIIRNRAGAKQLSSLYYEGHPTAGDVLARVVSEVASRCEGLQAVAVSHRLGELEVGDTALACAVTAKRHGDAFAACAELVNAIETNLPVWKHRRYLDGTNEWADAEPVN